MTHAPDTSDTQRAARIIEIMGGVAAVAKITARSKTRVYSWTYPKDRHGTGGLIPADAQQRLMQYARAHGLPLDPADFFPATRPEDAA